MKATNVKVQFVQKNEKKGTEAIIDAKPMVIETDKIDQIAATIVKRILFARMNFVKFGRKIGGFNFSRKFNIRIQINNLDAVDFTDLFAMDNVNCDRTLQVYTNGDDGKARTAKIFQDFAQEIYELVRLACTAEHLDVIGMLNVEEEISELVAPLEVKQLVENTEESK